MPQIHITIDDQRFSVSAQPTTGRDLKRLVKLSHDVTLFLAGIGEDRVVLDDTSITLTSGARLFSLPAAVYGHDSEKDARDPKHPIVIHINRRQFRLENPVQTGRALKQLAGIPLEDVLFLDRHPDDLVVANDSVVTLRQGDHLHSQVPATYGSSPGIPIHIDKVLYRLTNPEQTGLSLKQLAGLDPTIVLFLDAHPEDIVVANDATVTLRPGAHLHSQIPGDYGLQHLPPDDRPRERFEEHPQPDGWMHLILRDMRLPPAYAPERADVLIKLPPLFPDAQPDMFWTTPGVQLRNGAPPQNTSLEQVNGATWLRFSWHLARGAWKPGISTLQDYIRCIRGRFERGN